MKISSGHKDLESFSGLNGCLIGLVSSFDPTQADFFIVKIKSRDGASLFRLLEA